MSNKDERKSLVREVTNDLLRSKFTTEVGQKAVIQRNDISGERIEALREVLKEIGMDLLETNTVPKGMTYAGSLSIHVYKSELLKTAAFATLSCHESEGKRMSFDLADAALRELTGTTLETYGKGRRKLRSGF